MKTRIALIVAASTAVGLVSCDDPNEPITPKPVATGDRTPTAVPPAPAEPVPRALPSEADEQTAAEIRRLISEDKSLSTPAKECKIAVSQGVVTLTGVVDLAAESESIESKARGVPGVVRVDNQLEVKQPTAPPKPPQEPE